MTSLPERWVECPKMGTIIEGTRLLPFKTPLGDKFIRRISPTDQFTPQMLIDECLKQDQKIGLWIDLTYTNRYYDKRTVESNGIIYLKIWIEGGPKTTPKSEQVKQFLNACKTFSQNNPTDLIGVHCTHGMNRTGYLICCYLVEVMNLNIEDAFNLFKHCRPPGIYNELFINKLFRLYKMNHRMPRMPTRPLWKNTSWLENDKIKRNSSDEIRTVFPLFMYGMNGVEFFRDANLSERLKLRVQRYCFSNIPGFPGIQPVPMCVQNVFSIFQNPYKVTWQSDGLRCMMLILGEEQIYLFDVKKFNVFKITDKCPKFFQTDNPQRHLVDTLLDGEMILTSDNGIPSTKYLIRDVIRFEKEYVGFHDFNRRSSCVEYIIEARNLAEKAGHIDKTQELFQIEKKDFRSLYEIDRLLSDEFVLANKVTSLIFQPVNEPYQKGQSDYLFEWDPQGIAELTVDFRVRVYKPKNFCALPDTLASLFVSGLQGEQLFATINATEELISNNGKIVGCYWNSANNVWMFKSVAHCKEFPDTLQSALLIWENLVDPLTKENLCDKIYRNIEYCNDLSNRPPSGNLIVDLKREL